MSARDEPPGFEPIWQAIKGWDICRNGGSGYHGPTGDDVRHILAALRSAPEPVRLALARELAGEDWAVVPVEPTQEMHEAGFAVSFAGVSHEPMGPDFCAINATIYRAMLAAAVERAATEAGR